MTGGICDRCEIQRADDIPTILNTHPRWLAVIEEAPHLAHPGGGVDDWDRAGERVFSGLWFHGCFPLARQYRRLVNPFW